MMDEKLVCGDCKFSAFLVDEEDWWCSKLKEYVDPDQRQKNCPRADLGKPDDHAERDV